MAGYRLPVPLILQPEGIIPLRLAASIAVEIQSCLYFSRLYLLCFSLWEPVEPPLGSPHILTLPSRNLFSLFNLETLIFRL